MMRWRTSSGRQPQSLKPPPNYLSRSVQQRLLVLVGMLLLVLVAMNHARRPDTWRWLWQTDRESPQDSVLPTAATVPAEQGETEGSHARPSGLDAAVLETVQDDSHFRAGEKEAWFAIWQALLSQSEEELAALSQGEVTYLQLARQTAAYRGQVVNLHGVIRRAERVAAPANNLGIDEYWQCWLFPVSGPREPIVLYVLEVPESWPSAGTLAVPVALTGIVYKRWSYRAADGLRVAPVILATRVRTSPSATTPQLPRDSTLPTHPLQLILVAALASAAMAWFLFRYSSHLQPSRRRRERLPQEIFVPVADDPTDSPRALQPAADSATTDEAVE